MSDVIPKDLFNSISSTIDEARKNGMNLQHLYDMPRRDIQN